MGDTRPSRPVIVDDLHIVYRVYGADGRKGNATTALRRIVRRQSAPTLREVHAVRGSVLHRLTRAMRSA